MKRTKDETTPKLRPYTVTARDISRPSVWPDRARKCRDNPDSVIIVVDGRVMRRIMRNGKIPAAEAFRHAESARIFIRHTDSTAYAVALVTPYSLDGDIYQGTTEVYYGQAAGYGFDRVATALAGIPVGVARSPRGLQRVILTDHCGLDGVDHPWRTVEDCPRQFTVHSGSDRCLPGDLFTV